MLAPTAHHAATCIIYEKNKITSTAEVNVRYISFKIRNFKGIRDTEISMQTATGASVFAFVGLNESGKTTVLEAIHSFAPDEATSELLGGPEGLGVPFKERVPRHMLSEFTGDVSVIATLSVSEEDKERIAEHLHQHRQIRVDISTIPDVISFERVQRFKNGDFKNNFFDIKADISVKKKGRRNWQKATGSERVAVRDAVYRFVPRIAYFPTFVFDFPRKVFLSERGGIVDKFYRRVFQDILDSDGKNQTIERDIIGRLRRKEFIAPWPVFWPLWTASDDKEKIQQVMDRASAAVTRLVFGRWNQIFGEDSQGREVIISYDTTEGEVEDQAGSARKTSEHDIFVKFQIKDGTRRFDVNDRSLGFRWFFSFMLFTQFRVARSSSAGSPPMVFLFDEPASNLHAAAQQKLIDSFPGIAKNGHVLVYSTHSHYMIEPKWLEQTFIVTNRSEGKSRSVLDEASVDDESLDIKVSTYRKFVNDHPANTTYFQPILDRLEVVPSRFDFTLASAVVEGKSDYYILRYACKLLKNTNLSIIPALGVTKFDALIGLYVGWNLNFVFLTDSDREGLGQRDRYLD